MDFEPTHPKMGHLVAELAQNAAEIVKRKRRANAPTIDFGLERAGSSSTPAGAEDRPARWLSTSAHKKTPRVGHLSSPGGVSSCN